MDRCGCTLAPYFHQFPLNQKIDLSSPWILIPQTVKMTTYDSRPVSRRGVKGASADMEAGRPSTASRPITGMRPPSSLQQRIPMAPARISTGLLPPKTGASIMNMAERPVTQQGLTGLRTGTARAQKRQVLDKRYFEGLLRQKMKDIATEAQSLSAQIQAHRQQEATSDVYDARVKEVATELTGLQAELADLNYVVDHVHTGSNISDIIENIDEIRAENARDSARLEQLYQHNQQMEQQINKLDVELQNERNQTQKMLDNMSTEERNRYEELKQTEETLLSHIADQQRELEILKSQSAKLQEAISTSQIKQEAVLLYQKLREREERKMQLEEEEKSKASPAQEHEQLLQRVREDNSEMAAMERQMKDITEQIKVQQQELQLVEQDLEESNSDRHQKFKELKRREETMEQFLNTFEEAREAEIDRIQIQEGKIEVALQEIAKNLLRTGQLPSQDEFAVIKETLVIKQDELINSKMTAEELSKEEQKLTQNVKKVEDLEEKIRNEINNLTTKMEKMQQDMKMYTDLDKLRTEAQIKNDQLIEERQNLMVKKVPTEKLKELKEKNESLLKQLNENDTYVQLHTLEKKLELLQQNNENITKGIEARKLELDYEKPKQQTLQLMNDYNTKLKQRHSQKSQF